MMNKGLYQNKYRIESARKRDWNYGDQGAYFITLCTKNRQHFFGRISNIETIDPVETQCIASLRGQSFHRDQQEQNNPMQLSEIGKIVSSEWLKTPEIRPDMNLTLGEYVVMPNHFHAIIIIGENAYNTGSDDIGVVVVETQCIASLQQQPHPPTNTFGPQRKNLASIVRGFKSAVTMQARDILSDFEWQPRYHDHIIRNDEEYIRIANYIINNPYNWKEDRFNQI